jgi:hypothetical protein
MEKTATAQLTRAHTSPEQRSCSGGYHENSITESLLCVIEHLRSVVQCASIDALPRYMGA